MDWPQWATHETFSGKENYGRLDLQKALASDEEKPKLALPTANHPEGFSLPLALSKQDVLATRRLSCRIISCYDTSREMHELEHLAGLEPAACTPEVVCTSVAKTFGVKKTEVALLEITGTLLKFLYPAELKTTGVIPVSSSAVAARTARTRRAELFNSFPRVQHSSVFEVVRLGSGEDGSEVIQKLMSAPVLSPSETVFGVIQVCRKGRSAAVAGPDFTHQDLERLKSAAITIGTLMVPSKH